jgi:hypothetical protein
MEKRFREAIVDIPQYQESALAFYLANIQTDKYSDAVKLLQAFLGKKVRIEALINNDLETAINLYQLLEIESTNNLF